MIFKTPISKVCWWCGSDDLSGEHKFKASDIREFYGKGPWKGDESPLLFRNGRPIRIQSPKSDALKFANCICSVCNGVKSQRFDEAYSKFNTYILRERYQIYKSQSIDLEIALGQNWQVEFLNVLRYYAKQLSCLASTGNYEVSDSIIAFLNENSSWSDDLIFHIELRIQNFALEEVLKMEKKILYLGNFMYIQRIQELKEYAVESLTGWYTVSLVSVNYHYEKKSSSAKMVTNELDNSLLKLWSTSIEEISSELGKEDITEIIPNLEAKGRSHSANELFQFVKKIKELI